MKSSPYSHITDELLSAYIDNAVTEAERALIEQALAADAEVAWRLETLRRTVQLVKQLPAVPLPRSFVLEERHLVEATMHQGPLPAADAAASTRTSWRAWLNQVGEAWWGFWQAGNLRLRNAAAASLALFLLLTTVGLWQQGGQGQQLALTPAQPTSAQRTARAAPEAMTAATVSTQASKAQAPDQPETGTVEAQVQVAPAQAEAPEAASEGGEAEPALAPESESEPVLESTAVAMAAAPEAGEGEMAQTAPEEAAAGAADEGDVATVEAAAVPSPAQPEAAAIPETAPEAAPETSAPETTAEITTESVVTASSLPTNPPTSSRSLGPAGVEVAPPGGIAGGYGVGGGDDMGGGGVAPPLARGYGAPPAAAMAAPAADVAALPPPSGPAPGVAVESAGPVTAEITATAPITQTQALEVAPQEAGVIDADTAGEPDEGEPAPAETAPPEAPQVPTPVPTASPSPTPSPEPPAPTGAELFGPMDTVAVEPATGSAVGAAGLWSRLFWLQVTAALLTVTLSALWWRSRGRS